MTKEDLVQELCLLAELKDENSITIDPQTATEMLELCKSLETDTNKASSYQVFTLSPGMAIWITWYSIHKLKDIHGLDSWFSPSPGVYIPIFVKDQP